MFMEFNLYDDYRVGDVVYVHSNLTCHGYNKGAITVLTNVEYRNDGTYILNDEQWHFTCEECEIIRDRKRYREVLKEIMKNTMSDLASISNKFLNEHEFKKVIRESYVYYK